MGSLTSPCLGNYHHFWHELKGLLTASLLLLNSLPCWLMMKREHRATPLLGLWHNVHVSPVARPAGQAKRNTHKRDCMNYHRGAGHKYIIHTHLKVHTPWQHTLTTSTFVYSNPATLSYQWQRWGVIHPRRCSGLFLHRHQIPQRSPVCSSPHSYSCEVRFLLPQASSVCARQGLGATQSKHTNKQTNTVLLWLF